MEYEGKLYAIGDVIGWQAKYWRGVKDGTNSPLDNKHKSELVSGFKKTNSYRPNIKLWIICTPGSFVQKEWDKLLNSLAAVNTNCRISSWHRDIFESFLIEGPQRFNGIFQYHFGNQYIGIERIYSVSKDTLVCLKSKYDTDLHTPSDFERIFLSVDDNEVLWKTIRKTITAFKHHIDQETKHEIFNQHHWGYDTLTDKYRDLYVEDINKRRSLCEKLVQLSIDNETFEFNKIQGIVDAYKKDRAERVNLLNVEIQVIYAEHKDEHPNLKYYLSNLVGKIKEAEEFVSSRENHESIVSLLDLHSKHDFAVFAEAGFGKTHFACSLAEKRIKRVLPVLFFMGSHFRNCNSVENKIRELLQLPTDLTTEDILDTLDFLASLYGCKLPIIIDGLNETAPTENRWQLELPPLIRKIRERDNLVLITTCREKKDYVNVIYGKEYYTEVDNNILLKGIAPENLHYTVGRYFKNYDIHPINTNVPPEFSNPLLLKVFCLTNKGRSKFKLDSYSLASCMQAYSEWLVKTIATKDGKINICDKHKIEEGLNKVSLIIWENNDRCISLFNEFIPAFGGNYLNGFLNEGMCFMLDRNNDEEQIQFSYDMVAGYNIAKSILAQNHSCDDLVDYINENRLKFFGANRHTLAEDVNKSLFYLIPISFGKQWFEIMDDADVISACVNHLDVIVSQENGRDALSELLSRGIGRGLKRTLLDALYRRIIESYNLSHVSLFVPLFLQLTQQEWDFYWNCKFAEYGTLQQAYSVLHDRYHSEKFLVEDRLCFAAILCGVTDVEYREKYHALLQKLSWRDFLDSKDLLQSLLYVHDPFIFESVLSVISGAGLRTNQEAVTRECIGILERYMQRYKSNHIVLLDNLDTLYAYAEYKYGLKCSRKILSKNRAEVWPVNDIGEYKYCNFYSYDYDKYNIRQLYQGNADGDHQMSEKAIYGMLHARIASMGYDADEYRKLEQAEYEKAKYRSFKKCQYSHKYGRHALMELYGWLILSNYLKSEYKDSFRTAIVDIDPSSPKFSPKRSFFNQSLLPRDITTVDKWLYEDSSIDVFANMNNETLFNREGEWVLLAGSLTQKTDASYSNLYISRTCRLVHGNISEDQISELYWKDAIEYSHIFACELGWRKLEKQHIYTYNEENQIVALLSEYSFSSWSGGRFKYRNFFFLNPEVAQSVGLTFDVQTMNYYLGKEEVSAYYVDDDNLFFFIRKDVLENIMNQYDAKIFCRINEQRIVDENLPDEAPKIEDRFNYRDKWMIVEE
jgi:hypothetical protein